MVQALGGQESPFTFTATPMVVLHIGFLGVPENTPSRCHSASWWGSENASFLLVPWRSPSERHVGATQAASSCLVSEKPKELEWLLLPLVLTVTFPEEGSPWQEQLNKLVTVSECLPFTVWEVKMKIKWCMLKCWVVNGGTVEKDTWPVHLPLLRAV